MTQSGPINWAPPPPPPPPVLRFRPTKRAHLFPSFQRHFFETGISKRRGQTEKSASFLHFAGASVQKPLSSCTPEAIVARQREQPRCQAASCGSLRGTANESCIQNAAGHLSSLLSSDRPPGRRHHASFTIVMPSKSRV